MSGSAVEIVSALLEGVRQVSVYGVTEEFLKSLAPKQEVRFTVYMEGEEIDPASVVLACPTVEDLYRLRRATIEFAILIFPEDIGEWILDVIRWFPVIDIVQRFPGGYIVLCRGSLEVNGEPVQLHGAEEFSRRLAVQ